MPLPVEFNFPLAKQSPFLTTTPCVQKPESHPASATNPNGVKTVGPATAGPTDNQTSVPVVVKSTNTNG